MRFKVRLEDRRHWLLNSLRCGPLVDATTFADLEARRFTLRVSATRRDTKASRKDTKMQQGSELPGLGKGASSFKSERESLDGHAR